MEKSLLYTIGYGNRKKEDFIDLLKGVGIEYLIDVRSQPYSKFNPSFNQHELKFFLPENGIKYVFMGDTLGGRPKDTSCYNREGKVDYEILKSKDFFLQGIDRLKTAFSKQLRVIIMCSEIKPYECHRSKLIGKVLDNEKIPLKHIDEKGYIRNQVYVINYINKGLSETDLFGDKLKTTSRKSYL